MKLSSTFLTNAARSTGVPVQEIRKAAEAAVADVLKADVWFRAFYVNGKQFALSTRTVAEVDYLPNRVPKVTTIESQQQSGFARRSK